MFRGESSSNSPNASSRLTYHVFLSSRTEGTHLDFANTLCTSLQRKGISTFRYDEQVERGDAILEKLHKAIEQCLVVIVLLSKNYASSTWCLDELHKTLESKRVLVTPVFPLFYDVVPSDVRHQKNKFAEAFEEHATRSEEDKVTVQTWRRRQSEGSICLALEPSNMQHSSPSHVISPHPLRKEETCIYYWACKVPQGESDLTFSIGPKFSNLVYECNEEIYFN